jgi:hypothetical protein
MTRGEDGRRPDRDQKIYVLERQPTIIKHIRL